MELSQLKFSGLLPILMLVALAEALILHYRFKRAYNWRESAASVGVAIGQKVGSYLGMLVFGSAFLFAWSHRVATIEINTIAGAVALFFSVEFVYYWHHRLSHECRWFWASHAVHHSPQQLNFSAAYRLGWTAALTGGGLLFAPLIWLGFHPAAVFGMLAVNLLYQFWLHNDWMPKLGWFEWAFNTPSHHRVHHAINPAYLDRNYGGILIVYDRLFGTFAEERADDEPRYGLVRQVNSHNPFKIAFHEWRNIVQDLRHARSPRDVFSYLFRAPGWSVDGSRMTSAMIRATVAQQLHGSEPSVIVRERSAAWQLTISGVVCALFLTFAASLSHAQKPSPDQLSQLDAAMKERFAKADANSDGKLTRDEAKGKMPRVYDNFDAIDKDKKGYITAEQIRAYTKQQIDARNAK